MKDAGLGNTGLSGIAEQLAALNTSAHSVRHLLRHPLPTHPSTV
jgi:hypothetical protein